MKKAVFFLFLWIPVFLTVQLYTAACSFHVLFGDEGLASFMAYSMYEKNEYLPYHFGYGWAGDFHISYLASLVFRLLGASVFSVRITMIVTALVFLLLLFFTLYKFYSLRAAIIGALLFSFIPPSFMIWQLFHHRMILEFVLRQIPLVFILIYFNNCNNFFLAAAGFSAGFSCYSDLPNVFFVMGLLICIFLHDNKNLKRKLSCFLFFFLIGFSPFYFTASHRGFTLSSQALFSRYQQFLNNTSEFKLADNLYQSFSDLQLSFHHLRPESPPYLIMFLISICASIFLAAKKKDSVSITLISFFILYSMFYVFLFRNKGGGKYLLAFFQITVLMIPVLYDSLSAVKTKILFWIFFAPVLYFMIFQRLSVKPVTPDQDLDNFSYIIDFLDSRNISSFYAPTFIRYPVTFQSGFRVLGTSAGIEGDYNFPWITEKVEKHSDFAVILPEKVGFPEEFLKKVILEFENRLNESYPDGFSVDILKEVRIYTGLKHRPAELFPEKKLFDLVRDKT